MSLMTRKKLSQSFLDKVWFRQGLRLIIASSLYYTGLTFLSRWLNPKPKARILMYHSIADDPSNSHSVPPAAFEEQMRLLATKYRVISLEHLVDYLAGKKSLPDRAVIITFDDGLANNYTTAYPILKKYNLSATVFIVPDWIRQPGDINAAEHLPDKQPRMNWAQLREMSQNGISIGSHTVSHRSLPTLPLKQVRFELWESRRRLEKELGEPVKFFAYPYGAIRDFNKDIVRLMSECGYTCAVTSLSGANDHSINPYMLRRIEIEVNDSIYLFDKTVAGALDIWFVLEWLRWVSQVLSGHTFNSSAD